MATIEPSSTNAVMAGAGGGRSVRVLFDQPVRALAPGQAAVFYQGESVLGGGWIAGPLS